MARNHYASHFSNHKLLYTFIEVLLVEVDRTFFGITTPVELPLSVEADNLLTVFLLRRQLQCSVIGQLVEPQYGRILPVVRLSLHLQGKQCRQYDETIPHRFYFVLMVRLAVGRLLLILT